MLRVSRKKQFQAWTKVPAVETKVSRKYWLLPVSKGEALMV